MAIDATLLSKAFVKVCFSASEIPGGGLQTSEDLPSEISAITRSCSRKLSTVFLKSFFAANKLDQSVTGCPAKMVSNCLHSFFVP